MKIIAIVVTYNRKALLEKCLEALICQSYSPYKILVIDNNSSDGTQQWFLDSDLKKCDLLQYYNTQDNLGGAGGFCFGIQKGMELGADFFWIMDDDAMADITALEHLIKAPLSQNEIHGSIACHQENACWLTSIINEDQSSIDVIKIADIPYNAKVSFLPFLGLLIPRLVIDKIGLPDPSFFIAADDVEYCLRANKYGIDTRVIVNSKIFHPPSNHYSFHFPFLKKIVILKLPPWKRYYDTRNRLLVAKKHYGLKWIYQTIPGSFLRLIGTLINEPGRINQLHAFMSGLIDGILGIKGKRHEWWRIKQ